MARTPNHPRCRNSPIGDIPLSEIFRRERPDRDLPFTGERLTTGEAGQIEIEHLHRYFLARDLVRGRDVLEIACGEGYGAALLAQVARSVLAMDVSPEAVQHARRSYRRPNLTFRLADARRIEMPAASVDVVTSFETLEHFAEHERFYAELRRVLRPGGILMISTPERRVYSPDGSIANPFHVRELTQEEFLDGLRQVFPFVGLLHQRPFLGSVMLPANTGPGSPPRLDPALCFERRGPDRFESNAGDPAGGVPRALYLVAYASDRPVGLPAASLYIETSQLAEREAAIQQRLDERDAAASRRVQEAIAAVHASTSWRVTAPLRLLSKLRRPRKAARPEPAPPRPVAAPAPTGTLTAGEAARQREALGLDLPRPGLAVAVGVVTYNTPAEQLRRCLASARHALDRAGGSGRLLVIDNGDASAARPDTDRLPSQGNIGFGRAHNLLMAEAFAAGADLYIAANPDGAFHPDCIDALCRVVVAHEHRALVEAMQFPAEHPKCFDPVTLETQWASGACLAVPRIAYETIGGFDDSFFLYCEDVDLSWRARAQGIAVRIAPTALFLHAVTNRATGDAVRRWMLASGVILARKWGDAEFARDAARQLADLGSPVPESAPPTVPDAWRQVAAFTHGFSFSATRW